MLSGMQQSCHFMFPPFSNAITDGRDGPNQGSAPAGRHPAVLATAGSGLSVTAELPYRATSHSSGSHLVAAAVATLPWHKLPSTLQSLSLSGFVGLDAENIQALAGAAPHLR